MNITVIIVKSSFLELSNDCFVPADFMKIYDVEYRNDPKFSVTKVLKQTVQTKIRLLQRSSLILVYTVSHYIYNFLKIQRKK